MHQWTGGKAMFSEGFAASAAQTTMDTTVVTVFTTRPMPICYKQENINELSVVKIS